MIEFFQNESVLDILIISVFIISSVWFMVHLLNEKILFVDKRYCERCNKKRNYQIIDNVVYEIDIENKHIKFVGKMAICKKCGHEVFDEFVEMYNQFMFEDAYRKEVLENDR